MEQKLYLDGKLDQDSALLVCRISKRKDRVFTGSSQGDVWAVDARSMQQVGEYSRPGEDTSAVTGITVSPFREDYIAVYTDGTIRIWDTKESHSVVQTLSQPNQILGCGASPLAKCFATCSDDSRVTLYDLHTGKVIRDFEESFKPEIADGHKSRVFAVAFHPKDEHSLVSGGWDNTVQIWDMRKKTSARYLSGPYICGDGLDFNPNGDKLLTCSYRQDKNILVWDYNKGSILFDLTQDSSNIYCGRFIHPTLILTTSTKPSTVRIINMDTSEVVAMFRSNLPGMYCADAQVTLSSDKSAVINVFAVVGRTLLKLKTTLQYPKIKRSFSTLYHSLTSTIISV